MEEDGACKMDRQDKKAVVLERVGEGRIMLDLINNRKRNWLGRWLITNCLLKNAVEGMLNMNKVRDRRRYQMIGNVILMDCKKIRIGRLRRR